DEAASLIRRAASARAVESTAMNASSSRSHSVFMLYITGEHAATGTLLHGSLNLVDLAGSERLARSMVEGQRQKEACSINKSLSALGDVFAALSSKSAHVPYRNSKLTHLLQPCLGGTGKTLMFVNVNPEPDSAGETLCTLRFAAKVNACETASKGGAQRHVSSLSDQAAVGDGEARGAKRKLGSLLPRP
ncbi:kinesin, partial [Helicosporidium sp. ATCC 50920]